MASQLIPSEKSIPSVFDLAFTPDKSIIIACTDLPTAYDVATGKGTSITRDAAPNTSPVWSPDGSQIAFRRLVGGVGGNADVYVMNADGSAQRAVAETKASDVKPVWSPDGKNLVIVSNRKSAFGAAGKTWDLWLTRVSDGEVLNSFKLDADEITTPTWSYR